MAAVMFHRMFGRRKSPVNEEEEPVDAVEATEEKPENVTNDGFVMLDDSSGLNNGYGPPPGYTVGGANAFLPYGTEPPRIDGGTQRSVSIEGMTAIDGIPFKFGSNVLLEDMVVCPSSTASVEEMMSKIKSFNWDDYEYSFELERSIMKEFNSTENNNEQTY